MDNTLFMLTNPKKTKKSQSNIMDNFVNNYELHKNNTFELQSDSESSELSPISSNSVSSYKSDNEYTDEFKIILNNLNSIDNYILNSNNNEEYEIISNCLIDLLFLIKSKKSKK